MYEWPALVEKFLRLRRKTDLLRKLLRAATRATTRGRELLSAKIILIIFAHFARPNGT